MAQGYGTTALYDGMLEVYRWVRTEEVGVLPPLLVPKSYGCSTNVAVGAKTRERCYRIQDWLSYLSPQLSVN